MSRADVVAVDAAITTRARAAARGRDFYLGNPTSLPAAVGTRLARLLRQLELDYLLRFAAVPVDTLLDRVRLTGLRASGKGSDVVDRVWSDNDLDEEAVEAHRWTMVDGDGYLLAWYRYVDADEEGDDDDGEIEDGTAQIAHLSPLEAHVIYDRQAPTMRRVGGRRWTDDDDGVRVDLYYPDVVERWVRPKDADEWEEVGDPIRHPLGRVPMVHLRNRRPYGRPEHEAAFGPQGIITKTVATMMATMDYRGFPLLAALSSPDHASSGSSDYSLLDGDDDGDEEATLRAIPGELWKLTADQLVQIDAADLGGFLDTVDRVVGWMAALTAVPETAFRGWAGGQAPSGSALTRMESALTRRARSRQAQYGAAWEEITGLAVQLAGGPAGLEIAAEWEPAETADTLEALDVVQAKVDLGIPLRVALAEAGYRDDELDAWGITLDARPPAPTPPSGPGGNPVPVQIPGQLDLEDAAA